MHESCRYPYRARNPEKRQAWAAVRRAVESGDLPPANTQACERCGGQAEDWHHWSYEPEHWLDVIALCRRCHREADGEMTSDYDLRPVEADWFGGTIEIRGY